MIRKLIFSLITTTTSTTTTAISLVAVMFVVSIPPFRSRRDRPFPVCAGMERADLLKANADIFKVQGEALNRAANRDTLRVVVVGNPANTNAWIAAQSAPDLSPTQFTAMTRLDHDRGLAQLSAKTGALVSNIERFAIWVRFRASDSVCGRVVDRLAQGNHSSTMVPDVSHVRINDKWGRDVVRWECGD